MPYPNGKPLPNEFEHDARHELEVADRNSGEGTSIEFALVQAARAQTLATLAVAARLEQIVEALPGAGRGS